MTSSRPAPKAVLFDLDGTLVDSAPGIITSYHSSLRALGHEPDPAFDMHCAITLAPPEAMQLVLQHYGDTRIADAIRLYRHAYCEIGLFDATPYPGVEGLLQALSASGCRILLAATKRVEIADRQLEHEGLLKCFDATYGSIPGGTLDDKADLLAHIIAEQDIDPADAIMVGDRDLDLKAAAAVGMPAIGVRWGYAQPGELDPAGPAPLVDTIVELETMILGGHVRLARPDDLPGLMDLYASFASYDPEYAAAAAAPQWEAIQQRPDLHVVVAEVDGRVASTCTMVVVPNMTHRGHPWAVIENMVTHPELRQMRLGRRVLAYADAIAQRAGCYKITLATGSLNETVLEFYEGAGFKRASKTYFERRY